MRDQPMIVTGLCIFLAAITFPVWYNVAARTSARPPEPAAPKAATVLAVRNRLPVTAGGAQQVCVAPREYMRASHMVLLATWRNEAVRQGERTFAAFDGHRYEKSLTATCLACHESRTKFCDRCHQYAGVSPNCTDCHVMTR